MHQLFSSPSGVVVLQHGYTTQTEWQREVLLQQKLHAFRHRQQTRHVTGARVTGAACGTAAVLLPLLRAGVKSCQHICGAAPCLQRKPNAARLWHKSCVCCSPLRQDAAAAALVLAGRVLLLCAADLWQIDIPNLSVLLKLVPNIISPAGANEEKQ